MSFDLINKVNQAQKKQAVVDARSGDTVRVYQKIKNWLSFPDPYTLRYAIGLLLSNFLDEEFKQSDKYVILSVSSNEPNKNDVVICKVKTVDAPQKEENDNTIVVIAILVGLALFFSLSVGSRSRY